MLRARRKKATAGASVFTRRSRRTKRNGEESDGKHNTMGSVFSPFGQTNQEHLSTPQQVTECPQCSSTLKPAVVPAGCTSPLLQCSRCSATLLCQHCLYPCPKGTCTNQSCKAVSLLLTCEQVTDPDSKVRGCPVFRACPKCNNIMMHESGCKYVSCGACKHRYCFICLRVSKECKKDKNMYWSLTCTAPRAARQRFQT